MTAGFFLAILMAAGGSARSSGDELREAQQPQPLAERAWDVLADYCAYCHMPGGAVSEAVESMDFILDRNALVERARVIPRDPEASPIYEKIVNREMPPDGEPFRPNRREIETIREWIAAGAPDWDAPAETNDANWPAFRGAGAAGVAEGQTLPDAWSGESGQGVIWKREIPGLAHSSPIVWEENIFITTAIGSRPDATFRHGLYGDGDASDDRSVHQFKLYAIDKKTGDAIWEATAKEGPPRSKRHIKSTYASQTPATDGRVVVAYFGSDGLYAYDVDGKPLWDYDVGVLDVGAYNAPDYEWGPASSPTIYKDSVIVQCDRQRDSFMLALDLHTGEPVWRVERDELPSWGTPAIVEGPERVELVTNASRFIRGYDPMTGEELWRLGGSSMITAPTPIFADGLIVVASGRAPERPIFAIRPGASGDITLAARETSNASVAWSKRGRGAYMPTPLAYQGRLYVLANQGVLDCYVLETGEEVYRERLAHMGGGFSASPVAADGKIYLCGEDGQIFVVKAGDEFEVLATNAMGERLMATPAISEGRMFVRGERTLFAIGR
jgi:outer membrane protein assembly factor BamB